MTDSFMRLGFAAALGFALAAPAWGDTFKCVDANGRSTYTNMKEETKGKNCSVVMREISVVPAGPAAPATPAARSSAANPSPAGFPRVDPATQKARDGARRRILEEELAEEEKALAQAKAELTEQEGIRTGDEKNYQRVLDRLQKYKDEITRHENNVAALKKELSNTK
ncbi:MAG: DUF4124 domain-containing protein [Proteobacteria bacterium]|nr:DUF4124 domain-containing protein [Pseudomonadota bacterium]